MPMHNEQLIRMANDIGAFFSVEPDREEAALSISLHIKRFWDPRMRKQIIAHYRSGGEGLTDDVRAAVGMLAAEQESVVAKKE
jgi:formate dehydrogenase subunit delta